MKISLNEIKKYVDIKIPTDELIKLIGSRLVEVEGTDDWSKKYKNIYIVKVISCEKIEGTHLTLCKIDAGESTKFFSRASVPHEAQEQAPPAPAGGRAAGSQKDFVGSHEGTVQVVCGAPNVHEGMLTVWIAPGAIVPTTYGTDEPFEISERKLRGYDSAGMLSGADELGFSDEHKTIVEIDPEMIGADGKKVTPGASFADVFGLNDIILDIENKSLTHRPDTFGLIGFAREVAGILGQKFTEPEIFATAGASVAGSGKTSSKTSEGIALDANISDPEICPRYSCAIVDFTDTPHSEYLTLDDIFLVKADMRPISPIVDATNILMLKTGQPLHAFDYDKFVKVGGTKQSKIIVRTAKPGEKLELLDGKNIECDENDILITSNDVPVALAGAMGGKNTEIDGHTKRIILESATFSLYHLRKTQMKHGIFSEAITRFTKGQPSGLTMPVLEATIKTLGEEPLLIEDCYPAKPEQPTVPVTLGDINSLLGTSYDLDTVVRTLENVGLEVDTDEVASTGEEAANISSSSVRASLGAQQARPVKTGASAAGSARDIAASSSEHDFIRISVKPPFWRTDIHIKEDVIEEVGRLLGYDNIPLDYAKRPFIGAHEDALLVLKSRLRDICSDRLAANELLTYSFVSRKLQENVGENPEDSYKIVNSISPELQCFRQSLTPSLLEKVYMNLKAGYSDFSLYEINQVTKKSFGLNSENVPTMYTHLSFVTLGDFYQAKAYLKALFKDLNLPLDLASFPENNYPYLEPVRSAVITGKHEISTSSGSAKLSSLADRVDTPVKTVVDTPVAQGSANFVLPETIGAIGEVKSQVLKRLKIDKPVAVFELDLDILLENLPKTNIKSLKFSRFPSVSRDITVRVKSEITFKDIQQALEKALAENCGVYAVKPVSVYQAISKTKNLSFNLTFADLDHTLSADEISAIMKKVTDSVVKQFAAEII
ncbi:phenylalanine--tRNA ligase subunit beta [Candidatus Saccharibacteria bacterium]|nr:phenylalanine--tRNA ligase subunit beta [Candidatus Saccharibacteria bacterium]